MIRDAGQLSDLSIMGILIAAASSDDEGSVFEAWDILNARGWSDSEINEALENAKY